MAKTQGPLSGFRDLLSEQMLARDEILDKIKSVYELYGFVPLKTPALELLATLSGKYGEEGDKLMYSFEDNGGRQVALRYDQTVPLARVISSYSELPKPYKRYALGDVWRGERPQAGRYREFTQFDADIVGTSDYTADVEIIAMMSDAFTAIGAETRVYINDRRILDSLSKKCGIDTQKEFIKFTTIIDKIDKIGKSEALREVDKINKISKILDDKKADEACEQLTNILQTLEQAGYSEKQITFDQTIARGLSYYTGTIYETKLVKLPEIGSVCSGGRYDNLIKQLGGPDLPAIGTSIGVDRLIEGMEQLGQLKKIKTRTKVYILGLGTELDSERFKIASQLRANNIATEMVYGKPNFDKQFKDIKKLGISEVLLYGSSEQAKGVFTAQNLDKRTKKEVPINKLVQYYQNILK